MDRGYEIQLKFDTFTVYITEWLFEKNPLQFISVSFITLFVCNLKRMTRVKLELRLHNSFVSVFLSRHSTSGTKRMVRLLCHSHCNWCERSFYTWEEILQLHCWYLLFYRFNCWIRSILVVINNNKLGSYRWLLSRWIRL